MATTEHHLEVMGYDIDGNALHVGDRVECIRPVGTVFPQRYGDVATREESDGYGGCVENNHVPVAVDGKRVTCYIGSRLRAVLPSRDDDDDAKAHAVTTTELLEARALLARVRGAVESELRQSRDLFLVWEKLADEKMQAEDFTSASFWSGVTDERGGRISLLETLLSYLPTTTDEESNDD